MDFSNMTYEQVMAEQERLEASLHALKREQRRHDEIMKTQRKSIYDKLPEEVGRLCKTRNEDDESKFNLRYLGDEVDMEWHLWVELAKDIIEADQAFRARAAFTVVGKA